MWYFMPIPYIIINTGSKYRLTFYVKQRQKRQPLGAAFFVCQNRFSYIMFSSVKLYIFAVYRSLIIIFVTLLPLCSKNIPIILSLL